MKTPEILAEFATRKSMWVEIFEPINSILDDVTMLQCRDSVADQRPMLYDLTEDIEAITERIYTEDL